MSNQVILERVGEIPPDADVCHYDELDETSKHRFAEVVGSGSTGRGMVSSDAELRAIDCDIVKFTEYYHLGGR